MEICLVIKVRDPSQSFYMDIDSGEVIPESEIFEKICESWSAEEDETFQEEWEKIYEEEE